jgi:hypothetical protein
MPQGGLFVYLHIGQDTVVRLEDIIAIFDIETSSVSKLTRKFLNEAQTNGEIFNVTSQLPKSFIVCREKRNKKLGRTIVYISQISSTTLLKRTDYLTDISKDG